MTIQQKTVYQTADGKIFYSKEEAERHQNVEKAYDDAYNEHACYGTFEFLDAKEFAEFVCKYADMIRGNRTEELERLLEWSLDFMAKHPPKVAVVGDDLKNLKDANDILDKAGEYK